MENDVIPILHKISCRVGLRRLAEFVNNNECNCQNSDQLKLHFADYLEDTTDQISSQGHWLGYASSMMLSNGDIDAFGGPDKQYFDSQRSPFATIFGSFLVDIFKYIKSIVIEIKREEFEKSVDDLTRYISALVIGEVDKNFAKELGYGDYKRFIFLLRTTLSFFCDRNVDVLYPNHNIPICLVFQWAKCVVNIIKFLKALDARYIVEFERDVSTDIMDMLQAPVGTNLMIFAKAVKGFEDVSEGIEIKQPIVVVNVNSIMVMSILQSEIRNTCKIGAIDCVEPKHIDLRETTVHSEAVWANPNHQIVYLSEKVAINLMYKCSHIIASLNSADCILYFVALLKSFLYIKFGFCDFNTSGNFLKLIFKESEIGEYNSCSFLEWIKERQLSDATTQYNHLDYTIILTVLRGINELLLTILSQKHVHEYSNALEVARISLLMHMYYYKHKIVCVGCHRYDLDFYTSSYKYWIVLIDSFKTLVSDEILDYATCNLVMILDVAGRAIPKRQLGIVPRIIFSQRSSVKVHESKLLRGQKSRGILRVSSTSYTCCKALVFGYLKLSPTYLDILNVINSELKNSDAQIHSLTAFRKQQLTSLFRSYADLKHSHGGSTKILDAGEKGSDFLKTGINIMDDSCLYLPHVNERLVCLICMGTRVALVALNSGNCTDDEFISLSTKFINSFVLLMLDIEQVIANLKIDSIPNSEVLPLFLDTLFHVQMLQVDPSIPRIGAYMARNVSICDVIVEFMVIGIINRGIEKSNDSREKVRWLSFILLLRCMIASPKKNIFQVVTTLISMARTNVDSSNKSSDLFSEENGSDKSSRIIMEKLLVHALARYLSHVTYNIIKTQKKSGNIENMDIHHLKGLTKSIYSFFNTTNFNDAVYNCGHLLEYLPNLAKLLGVDDFKCVINVYNFCNLNDVLYRSSNSVAHAIPFVSDYVNNTTPVEVKRHCYVTRRTVYHLTTSGLSSPQFCFYCKCRISNDWVQEHYYIHYCPNCGYPCPLLCHGQMDLANFSQDTFVCGVTCSRLATSARVMYAIVTNAEARCKSATFMLDDYISSISNLIETVLSKDASAKQLSNFMEYISSLLAMYIVSVATPSQELFPLIGKLTSTSGLFSATLMDKVGVFQHILQVLPPCDYLKFYKDRFSRWSLMLTDGTLESSQLETQYIYDCLMLRIYSNNILNETVTFEDCISFDKRTHLLQNLSVASISQALTRVLKEVFSTKNTNSDNDGGTTKTFANESFTINIFALSKLAAAFSMSLNRMVNSGLASSLLDHVESNRLLERSGTNEAGDNLVIKLQGIMLNPITRHSLNVSYDHPFGQVIPQYRNVLGRLEHNDYALFRLFLDMKHEGVVEDVSTDDLVGLYKYKFHAFIRLLWFTTNPHLVYKLTLCNDKEKLLYLQSAFVSEAFGSYLWLKRQCAGSTEAAAVEHAPLFRIFMSSSRNAAMTDGNSELKDVGLAQESLVLVARDISGDGQKSNITYFVEENFIRILELFVTVWLKSTSKKSLALKAKRIFYPDTYLCDIDSMKHGCQMERVYRCVVILLHLYENNLDVFCDRLIEAMTIGELTKYNCMPLLECWALLSEKLTIGCLAKYAPGITYHVHNIYKKLLVLIGSDNLCGGNDVSLADKARNIVECLISRLRAKLETTINGKAHLACLDAILISFKDADTGIIYYKDLQSYAMLIFPWDAQPKLPYITREAGALAAYNVLSRNIFVQNNEHCGSGALLLAKAALKTLSEFSDDLAKTPSRLASTCCSILGYLQCDLSDVKPVRHFKNVDWLPSDDINELATIILKHYLVPNMHLNVTSYCMQEMLKLLGFHIACVDDHTPVVDNNDWNCVFDEEIQSRLEPYRRTNFLRNRQIEMAIEHQLEANTVLDIKCLVWWIIKMLPQDCPKLALFKACDLAMVQIPAVLSFLLPHIISSCVQLLGTSECMDIGRRIALLLSNVLHKDSNTFGINWGQAKRDSDHSQAPSAGASTDLPNITGHAEPQYFELRDQYTSCQAIFNLIDDIKTLVDKNTRQLEGIADKEQAETIVECIKRFKVILGAIPELLVAQAAISCGSYARGVMIIEYQLTFEPLSFDFSNPSKSLANAALTYKVNQSGALDPNVIISLLCRGYCGLSELDALICLSGMNISQKYSANAAIKPGKKIEKGENDGLVVDLGGYGSMKIASVSKDKEYDNGLKFRLRPFNSGDVCKAFSLECKGQYRAAWEIYTGLLKTSQNAKLWTCWYRIIQNIGPNIFIKFPMPIQNHNYDSLFAESITACWKLSLWDELDEILTRHGKSTVQTTGISSSKKSKSFDISNIGGRSRSLLSFDEQSPRNSVENDENNLDTFWASLLMRDSVDVWFMEKVACAMSLMHKCRYAESHQLIQGTFKHLVRPLGLAIRESTSVVFQYLEKIVILNTLGVVSQFNQRPSDESQQFKFASALIKRVQNFARNRSDVTINILGSAKVALELGGKIKAATNLSVFLTRLCRINDLNIHIPGEINLMHGSWHSGGDNSAISIEKALTLYKGGDVEGSVEVLENVASTDFDGLYNLVKIYSESNLLIPKMAVVYMHELLNLAPNSYKANLLYATYLDSLIENRIKNAQNIKLVVDDAKVRSRKAHRGLWGETLYILTGIEGIPGMYSFVELVGVTICGYLRALCFVTSRNSGTCNPEAASSANSGSLSDSEFPSDWRDDKMDIVDVLTRVITIMCFYCTANTKQFCSSVSFEKEACEMFFKSIHQRLAAYQEKIPAFYWYSVISQLVSRCQHKILGVHVFQPILARLLAKYPKHTLWYTMSFCHSVAAKNRQVHTDITNSALEINTDVSKVIQCYDAMFTEMHKVAMDSDISTKEKSALRFDGLWKLMNNKKNMGMVLIPTRHNLTFAMLHMPDLDHVCGQSESVQVLRSKQKPKKIGLLTQSGKCISFLIKNEIKGDLRKDMRMMEATDYIVRLLQDDEIARQLDTPLQSYSVIPLSEVSGIIEWVPNMCTMRALALEELRSVYPKVETETKSDIVRYSQVVAARNFTESLEIYRNLLIKRPPVLHRVYYKLYKKDPSAWYKCRKNFIYTCALWNMFGYIVGLGDRHAENILLNLKTGQLMHVDFDCLFGKGCLLQIPELVPFRLTQNIVANLGVCGTSVDGPYYSESLRFLKFLQYNRKKLTAILMSFVFDPLIDWDNSLAAASVAANSSGADRALQHSSIAQKALQIVQDKLRGIVHVILPSVEISRLSLEKVKTAASTDFGGMPSMAGKRRKNNTNIADVEDETSAGNEYKQFESVAEPLEPRQQLQQLIHAAISSAHLSKMFVGWAPWL